MQFSNDNTALTITDNNITIQQGDEALTVTAPVWVAEILQADKPELRQIEFSPRSQLLLYKLLKYRETYKPTPPQFNPVSIQCPCRKVLQFHDDGQIVLYDSYGECLSIQHKPTINAQIARARGYRIYSND